MEDLRNEIIANLIENGDKATSKGDGILIETVINELPIQMICKLGTHFPYEFPTIYLSPETWTSLPPMPHKNTDGSVCIFDISTSVPDFNNPVPLALATINKAKEIISDGIDGNNSVDYIDEFLAYWSTKATDRAQAFIEDYTETKMLYWIKDDSRSIIADSSERVQQIFKAVLGSTIETAVKGMLVPIDRITDTKIPKTDVDIVNLLKSNAVCWNKVNSFFQQNINRKQFFVLVCESNQHERGKLFGWIFNGPGIPNGFRKGHVNLSLAFGMSKETGKAIAVDDCTQRRLYSRGGDGREIKINSVVIVGCGSVGSLAAEAFRDYGTQNFILVDNDILAFENIARHYAGYFWVGKSKVDAISTIMQLHNPNLKLKTFVKNAFDFFQEDRDEINQNDLIVLAVASAPVEQFLIKMINESQISIPVIIIWVEPYAVAGHAILINHPMNFYQEIFDKETLEYQYNVVELPEKYNKRESGCQSTYMPYSAFGLNQMVYRILESSIKDYLYNGHNYRFTWRGRLREARNNGMKITTRYVDTEDYSLEAERID